LTRHRFARTPGSKRKKYLAAISSNPRKSVALLLYCHVGHLHFRISLIPVAADVLEGKTERLAQARNQRRDVEVNCIWIGSTGLQNAKSNIFCLGDLVERVPKSHVDDSMRDRLVTSVGDSSVDVGDAGADKILRRAHFQI